jgi:hypothetical protein
MAADRPTSHGTTIAHGEAEVIAMPGLIHRMWRAALLDADLYDEVESKPRLVWQALVVVLLVSVAGGLGAGWPRPGMAALAALLLFAGWIGWAGVSGWLGTRVLPEPGTQTDFPELLRTIGFAASPGLLLVFGVLPETRPAVFVFALLWMLAATVVAIREALDYGSLGRAVLVCALGWLVQVLAAALALFLLAWTARTAS